MGLCLVLVVFVLYTGSVSALEGTSPRSNGYALDQVVVKLKPAVSVGRLRALTRPWGVEIGKKLSIERTFVLRVPRNGVEHFVKLLSRHPLIEYAEPNYVAQALELTNDPGITSGNQWGAFLIQAAASSDSAWEYTHAAGVNIAIIDTGIDQDHPDVSAKITSQRNCSDSGTLDDLYGHGTHVAGIAGAVTNNAVGVAGIGYDVYLMNAKALSDNGSGYYSWIAECIRWAADAGAKVINMSLGGSRGSRLLKDALSYAWSRGAVLTCAAGNTGRRSRVYPAYYTTCIATASVDSDDRRSSFSTYDRRWVDVAAPGGGIYSTLPNHTNSMGATHYGTLSGTSMAAPHVAGVAALLYALDSSLTNSQVRTFIEQTADKIPGTGTYWKKGRINAYQAVRAALPVETPTPSPSVEPSVPPPTPTSTPTPTLSPTPTTAPSPTPTPSPTPKPQKKPWWCRYWPWLRSCR